MNMLARFFRPRPVVVKTYTVKREDWKKLRNAKCAELAAEIGWPWPLHRDPFADLPGDLESAVEAELSRYAETLGDPTIGMAM